jgi:hypothetical protein
MVHLHELKKALVALAEHVCSPRQIGRAVSSASHVRDWLKCLLFLSF